RSPPGPDHRHRVLGVRGPGQVCASGHGKWGIPLVDLPPGISGCLCPKCTSCKIVAETLNRGHYNFSLNAMIEYVFSLARSNLNEQLVRFIPPSRTSL
ncbi:MAG: hypothetical protein VW879_01935, partial [Opitutae bacterium]